MSPVRLVGTPCTKEWAVAGPDPRTTEFLNLITLLLLVVVILSGWIIMTRQERDLPRPHRRREKDESGKSDRKEPKGPGPS